MSKRDRGLVLLAVAERTTPEELCERLAAASGDQVGTVDGVLWRACSLGMCFTHLGGARERSPEVCDEDCDSWPYTDGVVCRQVILEEEDPRVIAAAKRRH